MGSQASTNLQVIPGFRRVSTELRGVRVAVAREDDAPFSVDAVVLEEDTWLALSAPADVLTTPGHPVRVMTQVWEARPEAPGTVVVRGGTPLRLLAVVHDLNAEPSWREEWVRSALAAVFDAAAGEGVRALRLPMLCTRYGRLAPQRFVRLLGEELERHAAREASVRAVWLVREGQCGAELLRALQAPQSS
jgi:hypothetical protein